MIGNEDCFSQKISNSRIMKSHLLSQICIVTNYTDLLSEVVYMSYKILLFAVGSRDYSQADIFLLFLQVEQIHKMTTIFTQNGPICHLFSA